MTGAKAAPGVAGSGVQRLRSLDAVRGVAALVVLIGHAMMVQPSLADAVASGSTVTGWSAWWTYSPLHLGWAGGEAVYVFFVLSGVVLSLPFLEPAGPRRWQAYFASRIVRLYLPVAGSLALASALFLLVPRNDPPPGASWWLRAHDLSLSPGLLLRDLSLLWPTSTLNSPLWSLRWEVMFSLALPLFVLAARRLRGVSALIALCVLLAVTAVGAKIGVEALVFLPMFGVGCLIAANRTTACALFRRITAWQRVGFVLVGFVLLGWRWWPPTSSLPGAMAPTVLGAALLVLAAMAAPTGERFGDMRVPRWLGSRSFSLYLVHEPILVSTALVLDTTNPGFVLLAGGTVALGGTELFFRSVERPSHRLAVRVGRRVAGRPVRHRSRGDMTGMPDGFARRGPSKAQTPAHEPRIRP